MLCKFDRADIITICQKNKVMAIVNRRSTERCFDPPPYNSLLVLCEVIVRDFADAQKCEMILTGPVGEGTDTDHNWRLSQNNHAKIF